jgi:hypothetical protein
VIRVPPRRAPDSKRSGEALSRVIRTRFCERDACAGCLGRVAEDEDEEVPPVGAMEPGDPGPLGAPGAGDSGTDCPGAGGTGSGTAGVGGTETGGGGGSTGRGGGGAGGKGAGGRGAGGSGGGAGIGSVGTVTLTEGKETVGIAKPPWPRACAQRTPAIPLAPSRTAARMAFCTLLLTIPSWKERGQRRDGYALR